MIENILNIKYVWRFKNFWWASADVKFEKNTFIFWKNTYWKSTFTSILTSIYKNNPDYIIWRKSFWCSWNQEIKIKNDTGILQFNWSTWNNNLKIKVFDSHYITENIYNNDYLDDDKQGKIASIILWEEWKTKETRYLEDKKNCDNNSKRKGDITRLYNSNFDKNIIWFDWFRKLNWLEQEKLDSNKEQNNKILNSYKNQKNIKSIILEIKQILNIADIINITLIKDKLEVDWGIIRNHINKNIKNPQEATNYLATWVKLLNWDNCSFCWQELDDNANSLIKELNKLFSESYKRLSKDTKSITSKFSNINIESKILTYKSKLLEYWIDLNINEFITDIKDKIELFNKELENKTDNLNYEINFDSFNQLIKTCDTFYADKFTTLETTYFSEISAEDYDKVKNEIKINDIKIERIKEYWASLSAEYTHLEKEFNEDLKPLEEKAFEDKKEYAKKVLSDYEEWINIILDKLNACFRLSNFSVPETRRGELNLFSLNFLDHDKGVPLSWDDKELNLKNTLSESDKRLLAFAFFITEIKKLDNLDEYIIVFDDPMSSLDSDRKLATIELIRDFIVNKDSKTYNQVIILTHEENFFKFLNDRFRGNKKLLRIDYSPSDKTSSIIPCDIEEEFFKDTHFKNLELYNKNIEENDFSNCDLKYVRIILEHIIDRKYYIWIDKSKRKSGWIVKWFFEYSAWKTEIQTQMKDIFPNISHHDQPNIKEWDLEEWDKRNIIKNLFELIKKI